MSYARAVAAALVLIALGALAAACEDEKKPPMTPDGPEQTMPVGSDGGAD